jgi:probable rRNA maturation factor
MPSASGSKVYFHKNGPITLPLRDRARLKSFIEGIFKKEKTELSELNYIFCSDKFLLNINREYLNHDEYTDIITFNLSQKDQPISGEIYISIDRVRDNARQLGESLTRELHRVIFHGALHLCGYSDKTKAQTQNMRRKEEEYLSAL